MSGNIKRELTLDEEVMLAMPYVGIVGLNQIKTKLGEITGLEGDKLDVCTSSLENSIANNEKMGYLWRANNPLTDESLGYMLSTKGLQFKNKLKEGVGEGRLVIGGIQKK